jgi:transcriptional regulator with XRE-family HTH domain
MSIAPGQVIVARELLGWTQLELAARGGLDPRLTTQFEAGRPSSDWNVIVMRHALAGC